MSVRTAIPPLVSVIIPAHNYGHYLQGAVESVLAQTHRSIETIVVDDGSTDTTPDVVRSYGSFIRHIRLPGHGVSRARNAGLAAAQGELVLFLDADDLLTPEAVRRHVAAFRRFPDAGAVYGAWHRVDVRRGRSSLVHSRLSPSAILPAILWGNVVETPSAMMIRREVLAASGGFDAAISFTADWDMWLRLARAGVRFVRVPEAVVIYRVHAGSMTRNLSAAARDVWYVLDKHFEDPTLPEDMRAMRNGACFRMGLYLGKLYLEQGDDAGALTALTRGLRYQPNQALSPALYGELAKAIHSRGQLNGMSAPWDVGGETRALVARLFTHAPDVPRPDDGAIELGISLRLRLVGDRAGAMRWLIYSLRRGVLRAAPRQFIATGLRVLSPGLRKGRALLRFLAQDAVGTGRQERAMIQALLPPAAAPAEVCCRPLRRVKVLDLDLCGPLSNVTGLEGYAEARVLLRVHGVPVGEVTTSVANGRCSASEIVQKAATACALRVAERPLSDDLTQTMRRGIAGLFPPASVAPPPVSLPAVTVAVCTRDRTEQLRPCLEALSHLLPSPMEMIVVDNAPTSDATERMVRGEFPSIRYVREPRPGLDWARNRAIAEARGEIIAYTDDDVIVDPRWVEALAGVFAQDPHVMAVTGLVMPAELETPAQLLFERYGGFGRGFARWWYVAEDAGPIGMRFGGSGRFGTGANMAYRRTVFDRIGPFDPALDVGTVTNGGGDLEMFFRVLKAGYTLVYEPAALVFHRHRETYEELRRQLANNGTGFFSYLVRAWLHYPDERLSLLRLGMWWFWWWNLLRLVRSYLGLEEFPRDLIVAELTGSLVGLGRYPRARRIASGIARSYGLPILGSERSGEPA